MQQLSVYCTGGTIDKVYFDALSDYRVGEPQIERVFQTANVTFDYKITSVLQKDSIELTDEDRDSLYELIAIDECPRILITHGTDTMTETAKVLKTIPGKTIVLTGAMSPARFQESDATFNIGVAVGAVSTMPPGCYLAMNGRVFKAGKVRKNREEGWFEETDEGE